MALGGLVHLLLEHALVYRADGPLRPPVDPAMDALRGSKGELGDSAADAARDALGAKGDLVAVGLRLAPLLGSVGIAHRHPHHGYRVVHSGDRGHAGDAPAGADDDLPVDRLA